MSVKRIPPRGRGEYELQRSLALIGQIVLATASERQRTIFALRSNGDMTWAEIAECAGCSVSAAKAHFARVKARIARIASTAEAEHKPNI